jgi:DNA-binding LacI/PurR family transcriptional regulator
MPRNVIDKTDPMPRYLQVRGILEESVRSGKYRPGAQLPGERELAHTLAVSQMTVNKAIQAMVADGWLRRETGKGTFVPDGFRPPTPAILRIGFAVLKAADQVRRDFYLSGLLKGIQSAVTNQPISLTLLEVDRTELYERIIDAPIDGCLLIDVLDRSGDDVARLVEAGRRIVILGADQEELGVPFVDSDNYGGTRSAVEHLIGLGHRRIAGVFAFRDTCNTRNRWRAYQETLHHHGVPDAADQAVVLGDIECRPEMLREQVDGLLGTAHRPTALFCGGYNIAVAAMDAVHAAGLRIPADISLVGFDDPTQARYLSPPLTTVGQPLEEMGRRATRKLVQWLRTHEEPPLRDILPATLQVRGSTAPVTGEDVQIPHDGRVDHSLP